jgi:hypothetical protein
MIDFRQKLVGLKVYLIDKNKSRFWGMVIFVLSILCVLSFIYWDTINDTRGKQLDKSTYDEPDERRRIYSIRGFSIIPPTNWQCVDCATETSEDSFYNTFTVCSPHSRKPHSISIRREKVTNLTNKDIEQYANKYLKGFKKKPVWISFQNIDTVLYMDNINLSPRNHGGTKFESSFCLVFLQDNYLYFIYVLLHGEYKNIPSGTLKYINTFKH